MSTPSAPRSTPRSPTDADADADADADMDSETLSAPYNPTYAAFSSSNLSSTSSTAAKHRSTILVHQKSPLLLATPPQITRALAYCHPFLLPLNKLVGLLSWTTGDAWESFLVLALFWACVQYGDVVVRYAGPIVVVLLIVGGMYARRYSPLSSSGSGYTSKDKTKTASNVGGGGGGGAAGGPAALHNGASESTTTRHQKTLDEIVETVKVFTSRCNILLEPMLELTDFLSTQRTATSATTRPALITLFVRIVAVTPAWVALTLPPWKIITTKRVSLVLGTIVLTWHSRVCRVSRAVLWRSASVRRIARFITGFEFEGPKQPSPPALAGQPSDMKRASVEAVKDSTPTLAPQRERWGKETGVRFTFIIYENQRRWVGLGWTNSLFAYERAPWTDEQNNAVPSKDKFELPEVSDGHAKWRWCGGSKWRVDGVPDVVEESEFDGEKARMGWVYYDSKWQNGKRGHDGWGRWTRRRKWYRDGELVEADDVDKSLDEAVALPSAEPSQSTQAGTGSSTVDEKTTVLCTSAPTSNARSDPSSDPPDSKEKDEDSLSAVLSTSPRSVKGGSGRWRFMGGGSRSPSLRGRPAGDGVHRKSSLRSSGGGGGGGGGDDHGSEGNLTPALELEIQGRSKQEMVWGVGDDVAMSLA